MKKIGILTLHFYENFGSVLQAYALKKKIEHLEADSEVQILNYVPEGLKYKYFEDEQLQLKYEEKQKLFDDFRANELAIAPQILTNKDLDQLDDFDYLVVGSDQVWNPHITHLNPAYFLNFASDTTKKISYAASLAIDTLNLDTSNDVFKRYIPGLDFISLREKTHKDYIQAFTERPIEIVLDPTMLLSKDDYQTLIGPQPLSEQKYILMYFLTHDANAIDICNLLARKLELPLLHYFADMPDRLFVAGSSDFSFVGPKEFLNYLNHAELVFTNSFHGTVFSILFETPFYTYTAKREMLSRVVDLTEMLKLESRRLPEFVKMSQINLDINFADALKRLEAEREKSINFLAKALGE